MDGRSPNELGDEVADAPVAASSEAQVEAEATASEPPGEEPPALPVRELTVEVDGQSYAVRIIGGDPGPSAAAAPSKPAAPTVREGTVVSPMQGLLLKVNVEVGDRVALVDVVVVLEAMKMQNDITATRFLSVHVVAVRVVGPRRRW